MTSLHPQQRCTAPQKWISPDQFGKDLEKAISGAFPTGRTPYGQVFVLLTSWEYDDETEDIDRDIPELQRVFTSDYNYVCKRYRIPTELQQSTPESALKQEMIDFASMGTSKDLLIFYYAGHSLRVTEPEKSRPFELHSGGIHYSHQDQNGREVWTRSKINFSALMKQTLEQSPCAVLYLMDCCYSSAVAMESRKEVFAASAVELPTVSTLWTQFFTRTLKSVNKMPITVAQLHGMMMKHCVTEELVMTPVHSELGTLGSVVLAPVTGILYPYPHWAPRTLTGPRVLISVRLEDINKPPSVEQWAKWLKTHTPADIGDVEIELSGFYRAGSSMLLLVLPTEIWVALTGDSYSFVGFVRTKNLLLEDSGLGGVEISTKARKGNDDPRAPSKS